MTEGVPFGPYLIIKRLAMGGMAEVFLARAGGPQGSSRLLVLKRMLPVFAADTEVSTMFLDEARIAAQLSHPFLIQVYDVGHVDRALYIAMEYVHGVNLSELYAAVRSRGANIPWTFAARIACYVCEALQYAHDVRGIDGRPLQLVHRDVSPSNIMLTYSGAPKLVDFGIARAERRLSVTQPGTIKGKLLYAAPEQYLNGPIDARTDLYGLGLCLYELLSGVQPFAKQTAPLEIAHAVTKEKPPPLSSLRRDVPKRLADAIHQAMEKEPKERPQSAFELRTKLEGALREEGAVTGMPELGQWLSSLFPGRGSLQPPRPDGADADAETLPASAMVQRSPHSTQPLKDADREVLLRQLDAQAAPPALADVARDTDPDSRITLRSPWPRRAVWLVTASAALAALAWVVLR